MKAPKKTKSVLPVLCILLLAFVCAVNSALADVVEYAECRQNPLLGMPLPILKDELVRFVYPAPDKGRAGLRIADLEDAIK
jgi:hypothetical protein